MSMKNSDKYFFSDFTIENYKKLLTKSLSSYVVKDFFNYSLDEDFIILRHDVDYSVHRALRLAEVEASLGIKSTYFLLLHSEFYNLFEKDVFEKVKKIISLGHDIGLHFDSHFYGITSEIDLEERLSFEKKIIESLFNIEIKSFCFHITNPFTLACNKNSYAGLLNVFSAFFQNEIGYCSDSNGYWRFSRLEDLIINHTYKHLQINTHPGWWQDEIMSPQARIERCINGRAKKVKELYLKNLKDTNRINIEDN